MEDYKDTYKTIAKPSKEILFKDKKSKFFASSFPIQSEDEIKPILDMIRKEHHSAGHVCYAWQLGIKDIYYRANDDGEPNNSAGMPIYGQLQSFKVTNILVAVARVYGGTKLGVGGLISAYRTAAKMALEVSEIVEKTQTVQFELSFEYALMDRVMRIIKQKQLQITSQQLEISCVLTISIRKNEAEETANLFNHLFGVSIKNKSY